MSVLMLRGPQTPGELKQRAERMHAFSELAHIQATLERLIGRGLCQARPPPGSEGGALHPAAGGGRMRPLRARPPPRSACRASPSHRAPRRDCRSGSSSWSAKWPSCARRSRAPASASGGMSHAGSDPRRGLRQRHRGGHPAGPRGRARLVPLALRAAARPRLPLHGDRSHPRGSEGGGGRHAAC